VGVGVDETRDHDSAPAFDEARPSATPGTNIAWATDGDDALAGHRQRRRARASRIESEDAAAAENPVGRYFIHPFSR
jgi:hypothetical protein